MFKSLFGGASGSTLLEAAFKDITTMLGQGGKMLDHAMGALFEGQPLDVDLDAMDDVIDNSERMVRRTVLQHLTVNPEQDLVASLILVSMVQDAERIGDFARGLGELEDLVQTSLEGPPAEELKPIALRLRPLFETCEQAFREDDVESARRVISTHVELKKEFSDYVRRLARSDLPADKAIGFALAARILRRISAHLSNISSTVTQPFDRIRHEDEET